MGVWDLLTGKPTALLEWADGPPGAVAVRAGKPNRPIKAGATLIVRAGQYAVLVGGGGPADGYGPGVYTLTPTAMPGLAARGLVLASDAPFRADVFLVSTAPAGGLPWATHGPVPVRGPGGDTIRVRAAGTWGFRVTDPAALVGRLAAADPDFETYRADHLRNLAVDGFAAALREAGGEARELADDPPRLARLAAGHVGPELAKSGVTLTEFTVTEAAVADGPRPAAGRARPALPPAPVTVPTTVDELADLGPLFGPALGQAGPMSGRIPLVDPGPDSKVFRPPAGPASGPVSGRLLLPDLGPTSGRYAPPDFDPPAAAPPPLPPAPPAEYHVALNGAPAGPFDLLTVAAMVRDGLVAPTTLVWKPGRDGWVPAPAVPELATLFPAAPPPLPAGG